MQHSSCFSWKVGLTAPLFSFQVSLHSLHSPSLLKIEIRLLEGFVGHVLLIFPFEIWALRPYSHLGYRKSWRLFFPFWPFASVPGLQGEHKGYWCPWDQGLLPIKKPLGHGHSVYVPISPLIARKFGVSVIFVSRNTAYFPVRHEQLFKNVWKHEATRYYWVLSPTFFFKLFLFAHTLSISSISSVWEDQADATCTV